MKYQFLDWKQVYTGEQLRSLFTYMSTGLLGDSMISWVGGCDVGFDSMVDGEDLRSQSAIRGSSMLHFIVEKFHQNLFAGVCLQRLLASQAHDLLVEMKPPLHARLRREGDDLFLDQGKLSISIATISPVSTLIHFAINCTNEGTPNEVETAALDEIGVDPREFADRLMSRFTAELVSVDEATKKVFWVE